MSEKIELKEKLAAVDLNAKSLWDDIDDDQRKALKSEFFILNRYVSSVKSSDRDTKEHFVLAVNEYYNKYWNDLQKHPKLLWQLLCMCSHENRKVFFHEWIGHKKKDQTTSKITKFLLEIYPDKRFDDIEVLAKLTSKKEAVAIAKDLGWDDREIAKYF